MLNKILDDFFAILRAHTLILILFVNYTLFLNSFVGLEISKYIQNSYFYTFIFNTLKIHKPEPLNYVKNITIYLMIIFYIFLTVNFIKRVVFNEFLNKKNILLSPFFKKIILHLYIITIWIDLTFFPILGMTAFVMFGDSQNRYSHTTFVNVLIIIQISSLIIPYTLIYFTLGIRQIFINEKKHENKI